MPELIPDFDLYDELEVSDRASTETIEAAWKSLLKRNHPDVVGSAATDRAIRLNQAHDWLVDPERRRTYDRARTTAQQATAPVPEETRAERVDTPVQPDQAAPAQSNQPPGHRPVRWGGPRSSGARRRKDRDRTTLAGAVLLVPRLLHRNLYLDRSRLGWIWFSAIGLIGVAEALGHVTFTLVLTVVGLGWMFISVAQMFLRPLGGARRHLRGAVVAQGLADLAKPVAVLCVLGGAIATLAASADGTTVVAQSLVPLVYPVAAALSPFAIRRRSRVPEGHGRSLGSFLAMSPSEFEFAVARILRRRGYRLRVVGGPGDGGVDLVGTSPRGRRVIVQCKRLAPGQKVGTPAIQKLLGSGVMAGADRLVFVTTAEFTADARSIASAHGIKLISGSRLVAMDRGTR